MTLTFYHQSVITTKIILWLVIGLNYWCHKASHWSHFTGFNDTFFYFFYFFFIFYFFTKLYCTSLLHASGSGLGTGRPMSKHYSFDIMTRASFGITFTHMTYQKSFWTQICMKIFIFFVTLSILHIQTYEISNESWAQGLHFLFLHLRALSNLWGRYDLKTFFKNKFLLLGHFFT